MTPIERAARVLGKDEYPEQPSAWHDAAWREYVPTVQAVLQAIREPSERMLGAGAAETGWSDMSQEAATIFRDMIDAALAEGV